MENTKESLSALEEKMLQYYPDVNIPLLRKAYEFARKKHEGQLRYSGEPYITHPLGVAYILAELGLDLDSIIAALLHDTVEDTSATLDEIEENFGKTIRSLVDGVTKISRINFRTNLEKQSENFRKMVVAMANDFRVILVKLADRTHNMRTLKYMDKTKSKLIAKETLEIYAPLANRLGINWMKVELEDTGLCYTKPETYSRLAEKVAQRKTRRAEYVTEVQKIIKENLNEYNIKGDVTGRSKHFYSIFKKMQARNVAFEDIHDVIAFRIVLDNITECYKALGVIHASFKPVDSRFKDYIAMPKPNGYQSLHTMVIGPHGERIEIQIRTISMHKTAISGIAAHWKYKEGRASVDDKSHADWLKRLMDAHESLKDPNEFLHSVKVDLYPGDVYVFTPNREVKEFLNGATPIDFAYSIHTDVGNTCVGAKVNGKMVPLRYKLKSGDVVEIITSKKQSPSKDWLKIVRSSKAITNIRSHIKQEERVKAMKMGEEILERDLRSYGFTLNRMIKEGAFKELLSTYGVKNIDELFISIGFGKILSKDATLNLIPKDVLEKIQNERAHKSEKGFLEKVIHSATKKSDVRNAVVVDGMDDILIRFARCCGPIPGDPITGYITRGRGVTIHNGSCPKVLGVDEMRRVDVMWNKSGDKIIKRSVHMTVHCADTPGILSSITQAISAMGINIAHANVRTLKSGNAVGIFEIIVTGTEQLERVINSLERKEGILRVERSS